MKRAFRYRFYPTAEQAAELVRTFGRVRLVYNLALAARTEAWTLRQERVTYNTTSAMLTAWKKTEELAFLNDVSSVPLQQTLRHRQAAFTNFFAERARYPTFKSWFPSSKLCSTCGVHAARMPLGVRSWTCRCGQTHDRDVNAARNLLAAGLAVTACGDGVRPQRETSRRGQPTMKQEHPRATKGIPVR